MRASFLSFFPFLFGRDISISFFFIVSLFVVFLPLFLLFFFFFLRWVCFLLLLSILEFQQKPVLLFSTVLQFFEFTVTCRLSCRSKLINFVLSLKLYLVRFCYLHSWYVNGAEKHGSVSDVMKRGVGPYNSNTIIINHNPSEQIWIGSIYISEQICFGSLIISSAMVLPNKLIVVGLGVRSEKN